MRIEKDWREYCEEQDYVSREGLVVFGIPNMTKMILSRKPDKLEPNHGGFMQEAKNAVADLQKVLADFQQSFVTLKNGFEKCISELRESRMTVVMEVQPCIKAMQELRQFFIGADHKQEIERLKEFVGICERLKQLKESGFLDSVADTILKVSQ